MCRRFALSIIKVAFRCPAGLEETAAAAQGGVSGTRNSHRGRTCSAHHVNNPAQETVVNRLSEDIQLDATARGQTVGLRDIACPICDLRRDQDCGCRSQATLAFTTPGRNFRRSSEEDKLAETSTVLYMW